MRVAAELPFAPRRAPFFYGWVIVAVATLGILCSIPGQTMGVSVFTDRLLEATGLSRLAVSNAYLVGTLMSGLTLPWAGTRVDRFGARPAALFAVLGLGAVLVFLSRIDHVAAALGGGRAVAVGLLVLGFFALRFTGQGLLTMVSRTMLGRWFARRRGLAAGLSGVFVGFGFGVAPQVFDAWIEAATWRGAWQQMAAVVALGMGLVILVFYRNDPEACGLRMDGEVAPRGPDGGARAAGDDEVAFTRGEALRTLAFWAVTCTLACHSLIVTGITFHIVDLGSTAGLDRTSAVQVFLPMSVVSTAVGLIGGAIADRVPVRALMLTMLGAQAVGILAVTDLSAFFWIAVLGLGVAGGLFSPIATVAYPGFFGRRHLGAIVGVEMMSLVVASALGPALLATSRSLVGGYEPALYGCLALPAAAAILALVFRQPARASKT